MKEPLVVRSPVPPTVTGARVSDGSERQTGGQQVGVPLRPALAVQPGEPATGQVVNELTQVDLVRWRC